MFRLSVNATWGPFDKSYDKDKSDGSRLGRLPIYYTYLQPNFGNEVSGTYESANLTVGQARWFDLEGEFVETNCLMAPAMMELDVTIEGDTISLLPDSGSGTFVAFANNTQRESDDPEARDKHQPATTTILVDVLGILVASNASAILDVDSPADAIYAPDAWTLNGNVLSHMNWSNADTDLNFIDPTAEIVFEFNNLMLRAAAKASSLPGIDSLVDAGVPTRQTASAHQTLSVNVFESDLRWLVLCSNVNSC